MDMAKTVGMNLKNARRAKGYTQKELAAMMYMTQQYSRFENGVFELNYGQIVRLCELLDVTPNELFGMN